MRQADLDCVRRLFRDDLFLSVDKLLSYPQGRLQHQDQEEALLETLQLLVSTAAHALNYRACLPQSDATAELDSDLVPVAQCMLSLFHQHRPLIGQLAFQEVPPSGQLFDYADNLADDWAQPQFSSQADDEDAAVDEEDEQLEPAVERHRWLVHLINLFGYLHGFDNIMQVCWHAYGLQDSKCGNWLGLLVGARAVQQLSSFAKAEVAGATAVVNSCDETFWSTMQRLN
jgi:hypothetical protein